MSEMTTESKARVMDRLRELHHADAAMMPFGNTLGFTVDSLKPGEAVVQMECDERHENVLGYTHGGAIFTLADTAIGLAHLATLEDEQTCTTVESKVNFLRPAWHGSLRAHAKMRKQGRTISLLECDILDGNEKLVAHVTGTMMTIGDDRATGRSKLHSRRPASSRGRD